MCHGLWFFMFVRLYDIKKPPNSFLDILHDFWVIRLLISYRVRRILGLIVHL